MPDRPVAKDRILNGALGALARYGSHRFSMTTVANEAGISRGTLYRYFPTKETLLDALTGHIGRDFREFLAQQTGEAKSPDDVVTRVVETMRRYVEETPVLTQLLEAEPDFVRIFYNEAFGDLVRLVGSALAPAFGLTSKDAGRPDVLAAGEVLVRAAISYRLVSVDSGPLRPGAFTTELAALIQRSVRLDMPAP